MYTLVGTSNTDTWFNIYPNIRNSTSTADTGETIRSIGKVAVVNGLKNELCTISIRDANKKDKTENVTSSDNKKHLSFDTDGAFIYVRPGTHSETFALMIVDENQTEDYEPYHEPQSMSVTTPNGLPGIPVASDGNYTGKNGQQWICDEVDFGRGVYVKRVKVIHIDSTRYSPSENNGSHWHVRYEIFDSASNYSGQNAFKGIMCTTMQVVPQNEETAYSYPIVAPYGHANRVELRFRAPKNLYTTIQDFQDIITGTEIRYPLAEPIETPLTASEIAAYKSLRTYRGTTIVEAEDKAGISVTYKRSAKTDDTSAEKKIEESEKKEYDES